MGITNIKIAIGVPTGGTMKAKTAFALLETVRRSKHTFETVFSYGSYVAENRGKIVDIAQGLLCSHVFFVDCDMSFPSDTLERLLAHDKDIVGVNYNYRYLPQEPVTKFFNGPVAELAEVAAAGTGLMLVKTPVFSKISRPFFPYELDTEGRMHLTEDVGFCEKAREAGLSVWVDPFIKVDHIGDYAY